MPAMGDSVAEGTVLEWHKQEGDTVAVDETIVEISTDKVDAEVPAPVAGTLVKIHAAEGDTVAVGALLAEIATSDGSEAAATEAPANGGASVPEPGPSAPAETIDIVTPTGGESVTEGTILEWAVKVGDAGQGRRHRRRDLDRQGRHGASRARLRHDHRDPGRGGRHRHRRSGDRADDRRSRRRSR